MTGIANRPRRSATIFGNTPTASIIRFVLIVASTSALGLLISGCGGKAAPGRGGGNGFTGYPSCNDVCDPSCSVYSPSACGVLTGSGGTGTGTDTGTDTGVGTCTDSCDASCGNYDAAGCDGGGVGDGGCDIDTCGDDGGGATIGDPGDGGGGDPGIGDGGGDYGGDGGGDYGGDGGGGGDPGDGGGDPGDGGGDGGDGGWDGGVARPVNGAHPMAVHSGHTAVLQQQLRPADAQAQARAARSLQLQETLPGFSPRDVKTMERKQAQKAQEEKQ